MSTQTTPLHFRILITSSILPIISILCWIILINLKLYYSSWAQEYQKETEESIDYSAVVVKVRGDVSGNHSNHGIGGGWHGGKKTTIEWVKWVNPPWDRLPVTKMGASPYHLHILWATSRRTLHDHNHEGKFCSYWLWRQQWQMNQRGISLEVAMESVSTERVPWCRGFVGISQPTGFGGGKK